MPRTRNNAGINESINQDLLSYFSMFGDSFEKKIELLNQLLQECHYPTLGTYKENLLKKAIETFIPKKYSIGSGFVHFPFKVDNKIQFRNSTQIDIIIYDSHEFAPIFTDGEFVVLKPESVKAIIEVKSTLDNKSLDETIIKFYHYAKYWHETKKIYRQENHNWSYSKALQPPKLIMMNWDFKKDKYNKRLINIDNLGKRIAKTYSDCFHNEFPYGFPLFSSIYVYKERIVLPVENSRGSGSKFGFLTTLGKIKKNEEFKDLTICHLIHTITENLANNSGIQSDPNHNEIFDPFPFIELINNGGYEHLFFEPWIDISTFNNRLNFFDYPPSDPTLEPSSEVTE